MRALCSNDLGLEYKDIPGNLGAILITSQSLSTHSFDTVVEMKILTQTNPPVNSTKDLAMRFLMKEATNEIGDASKR